MSSYPVTLPVQTETIFQPPSTVVWTTLSVRPAEVSTQILTTSLPGYTSFIYETVISTLAPETFTLIETSIQPASTILSSYPVTLPQQTQTTTLQVTSLSILEASTITTSYAYTLTELSHVLNTQPRRLHCHRARSSQPIR